MSKVIQYRVKCIGCSICFEQQPLLWRMSKKDGKAILLNAIDKKAVYVLEINEDQKKLTVQVARACPVKIIKVV